MNLRMALALLVTACSGYGWEEPRMIPIIERNGRASVLAAHLEREAGIAVKTLPGQEAVVVCAKERCALVKDYVQDGGEISLSVAAVAKALGLSTDFSADGRAVSFTVEAQAVTAAPVASVGQLAPNFRIPLLDGGTVSLADLRGKRVLINSWGSW